MDTVGSDKRDMVDHYWELVVRMDTPGSDKKGAVGTRLLGWTPLGQIRGT